MSENLMPTTSAPREIVAAGITERLPKGTFGVYEALTVHGFVCAALSKYAYPLDESSEIRRTLLQDGDSLVTRRPVLYFGDSSTKQVKLANVSGRLLYNGHRIPFWLAKSMFNGIGVA